jgi:hypothetical protein
VKEKLCPVPRVGLENLPVSLTMLWGAESRFVQVTIVPPGTVTEAGLKRKLSMVTATGDGATGVVAVAGGVVTVVAGGIVFVGTVVTGTAVVAVVVGRVVVGGAVVDGVVAGGCPDGVPVHPARRTAARRTAPIRSRQERDIDMLMEMTSWP